jgi:hypothetical protein
VEPFEFVILNNVQGQGSVVFVPVGEDYSPTEVSEFEIFRMAIHNESCDLVFKAKQIFTGWYDGNSQGFCAYILEPGKRMPWYEEFHSLQPKRDDPNQINSKFLGFSEATLRRICEARDVILEERRLDRLRIDSACAEYEKLGHLIDEGMDVYLLAYLSAFPLSGQKLDDLFSEEGTIQSQALRDLIELACVEVFCMIDLCSRELQQMSTIRLLRLNAYLQKAAKCLDTASVLCRQFTSLCSNKSERPVTLKENSRSALDVRHASSRKQRKQAEERWITLKSEGKSKNAAAVILKKELKTFSEATYRDWLQGLD